MNTRIGPQHGALPNECKEEPAVAGVAAIATARKSGTCANQAVAASAHAIASLPPVLRRTLEALSEKAPASPTVE